MVIDKIAIVLSIIGGLNWGCIGLFRFNFVQLLFGTGGLARTVYTLVGLAAIWCISLLFRSEDTPAERSA